MKRIAQRIASWGFLLFCIVAIAFGIIISVSPDEAPLPQYDFDASSQSTFDGLDHTYALSGVAWKNHCAENEELPGAQSWIEVETILDTNDPVLLIPSLCIAAPMTETDQSDTGLLNLPAPPYATRYIESAAIGADQGTSVVASHVNYNYGENAPFSRLHKIEKGAPIVVVESDGEEHYYTAEANELYEMTKLPDSVFAQDTAHSLNLITCSGSTITNEHGEEYFYYNLVVNAVPVE